MVVPEGAGGGEAAVGVVVPEVEGEAAAGVVVPEAGGEAEAVAGVEVPEVLMTVGAAEGEAAVGVVVPEVEGAVEAGTARWCLSQCVTQKLGRGRVKVHVVTPSSQPAERCRKWSSKAAQEVEEVVRAGVRAAGVERGRVGQEVAVEGQAAEVVPVSRGGGREPAGHQRQQSRGGPGDPAGHQRWTGALRARPRARPGRHIAARAQGPTCLVREGLMSLL